MSEQLTSAANQPKVNANASTPGSRNSISNSAIGDGPRLADQLIQPLLAHRAVALLVNVDAVRGARRLSIDAAREIARRFLAPPAP